jgi:predicted ATPase with chaperone activity
VARTITTLDECEQIKAKPFGKAIQYRRLDRAV